MPSEPKKNLHNKMQITVVGQGYVGLPLAIAASNVGYTVYGLDNNKGKIKSLCDGKSIIEDLSNVEIKNSIDSKRYIPTINQDVILDSHVILICVPTPLSSDHKPDLTVLIGATTTVGKNLKAGTLVIVESTIEPGTCRNILLPILVKESGLEGREFEFVYSPERIDPTNKIWNLKNTPKILAGLTDKAGVRAVDFYSKFIDNVIVVDSIEVAETAKLLENSFRLVNISFINEVSMFCQKLGIDINAVISAAATKPYGFMPFYPSLGVGGHCIPVDPLYLASKAHKIGAPTRFIDLADQVNQEMPDYFVAKAEDKLGGLKSKKVLVIGVSYKPNVADVRETPVQALIDGLNKKGAQVSWHDDLVKEWNGKKSVALSDSFDLAILATLHDYLDLNALGETPILNTRGSL